ncbi:MAG: hypothetical protein KC416_14080, partial [Myxococcales bacterium]|nr:hypothetical protein [Myxococcales bacterium]
MVSPQAIRTALCLLGIGGCLATAGVAHAQTIPYENHLLGDRSLGLGGSFVALADDPTAIFHNPGGIARLQSDALSGSLWVVSYRLRDAAEGFRADEGSGGFAFADFPRLPLVLAGVVKFGKRAKGGAQPHALGATVLVPQVEYYDYAIRVSNEPTSLALTDVVRDDRSTWVGISYGYQLLPNL